MLRKIGHQQMGTTQREWLESLHHFSFGDYYDLARLDFGVLRVVNDDIVAPGAGFPLHGHKNMEIITYVIQGALTHEDSLGNKKTLKSGGVQFMTAGTGVSHSEYNLGDVPLRLVQIWIMPDKQGHTPAYGDYHFAKEQRQGAWQHLVSPLGKDAPVQIYQDANIYATEILKGSVVEFALGQERQVYLVQISGRSQVNQELLKERDAAECREENLVVTALEDSHLLAIEMPNNHDWQLGQKLKEE